MASKRRRALHGEAAEAPTPPPSTRACSSGNVGIGSVRACGSHFSPALLERGQRVLSAAAGRRLTLDETDDALGRLAAFLDVLARAAPSQAVFRPPRVGDQQETVGFDFADGI